MTRARAAELSVLAALVVLGVGPLALMLAHAAGPERVFAGADGPFPADQFQYFAWIREYSGSLLADNDLDLASSDAVFWHPMFWLSGVAVWLGLGVSAAFLLWKPVAIAALLLGARAWVRRFLADPGERAAALALAVLFASPTVVLLGDDVLGATGEMFPAALLWGYLPAAISVGLMPVVLLAAERLARAEAGTLRLVAVGAAAGAVVSWLHPWQGQVVLVTLAVAVAVAGPRDRRLVPIGAVAAATLAPLLYYFALSRLDPSWELAQRANETLPQPALWTVLAALAPLAAVAAAGLRRPDDLGEWLLVCWAPATLLVFVSLSPSVPAHALEGISIPLAVLAVRGLRRVGRPVVTAIVVLVLVVPGALHLADWFRDVTAAPREARYLDRGERAALRFLEDERTPGGVVASPRLGALVPGATGRRTWVGHPSWTRDYPARAARTEALLRGEAPLAELARESGARFLLVGCGEATALEPLEAAAADARRFGCAAVLRLPG